MYSLHNKRRNKPKKGSRKIAQRGANNSARFTRTLHPQRIWNPISAIAPDINRTNMFYFINTNFTSPSNALTMQFAGNSVFDPEIALGGYQPAGFDQLTQFYSNFRVVASRIKVQVINLSNGPGSVTLYPSNN